jgi:hypothetical protein
MLTFQAGSVQTITATLHLAGVAGKLRRLRSSVPGSPWFIDLTGNAMLRFLDVQDSNATGAVLTVGHVHDSGNNINWRII